MELSDLEFITNGGYNPIEGFMEKADYESVIESKRLANSLPWFIV
jgi:sulfate adenylyltransferase